MQSMYIASRGIRGNVIGSGPRKVKKEKKKQPIAHRLYVPCMYYTCVGCFMGVIIFGTGAALVVYGFLTYIISQRQVLNSLSTAVPTLQPWNATLYYEFENTTNNMNKEPAATDTFSFIETLKDSLALVRAVICSIGGFMLMVVCVITCETRDKVFELMDRGKITGLQKNPDFYKLILETQKMKEDEFDSGQLIFCSLFRGHDQSKGLCCLNLSFG